jgi:hypothetical protein
MMRSQLLPIKTFLDPLHAQFFCSNDSPLLEFLKFLPYGEYRNNDDVENQVEEKQAAEAIAKTV